MGLHEYTLGAAMHRFHITGASGSGTTTLGRALSERLAARHFDVDDYYWERTDPPFARARPRDERLRLLAGHLRASDWVLSGSLAGWGDSLLRLFDLVIFVFTPAEIRLARLIQREVERYGVEALRAGGRMHEQHLAFLEWARRYDDGDESVRSLRLHDNWLADVPCPVLRLQGELPTLTLLEQVVRCVAELR